MRTPNTQCVICEKPLYRRPSDMASSRYAACMSCRGRAQSVVGVTEKQKDGLSQGREKGTNHRSGYHHKEESKVKTAQANKLFWETHPKQLAERGEKMRGSKHYKWKGGATKLNVSIRQMDENRKWMEAVKTRDGKCVRCSSVEILEAHHKISLVTLIETLSIKSREDARRHAAILWDIKNGETLCQDCHYKEHGRKKRANCRSRV